MKTKENSKEMNTASEIQKLISSGRKVLLKKENELTLVRIRYNNHDTDGTTKWRLLLNGNEFQVSEIVIHTKSRTFSEKFEDIGIKHHIICDAREIIIENNIANIY
jgi:adenine C2-methylase RlmN of 23S rRNA A2503 and tRNA A37